MISFRQENHSSRIGLTVQETDEDHYVTIIDSVGVSTRATNLWVYSPLVRSVLDTLTRDHQHLLILPDFSAADISKGLGLLRGSECEELYFNRGTKCFLETIGVQMTGSQAMVTRGEVKLESVDTSDRSEETEYVKLKSVDMSDTSEQTEYVKQENVDRDWSEKVEEVKKESLYRSDWSKHKEEVKCNSCERRFVGSRSKLKDKLKCHIGNIHFNREMKHEISIFFDSNNKCKRCGKFYHQDNMKRKHLTFNHSYLVDKIMDCVYRCLDPDSKTKETKNVDVEALLKSDNESSDEEEVSRSADVEEEDLASVQRQLLMIQDFSDSDEDDETVKVIEDPPKPRGNTLSAEENVVSLIIDEEISDDDNEDLSRTFEESDEELIFSTDEEDNDDDDDKRDNS